MDRPGLLARLQGLFSFEANPRRALAFAGIGAVIGLVVAAHGLFTARGGRSQFVPPQDVALVNNRPILATDYAAQIESEFAVPLDQATGAQRAKVLNDMIAEELFVQRGLELDLPASDPDTRTALVAGVEQQAAVDATASTPSEGALRAYYTRRRDRYSSEGRMRLTVSAPSPGAAARRAPARPEDWVDTGQVKGEEFYFSARIHLGDRLFAVARGLRAGQSAVVNGPDGPRRIVMVLNDPPVPQAFESARAAVLNDYRNDLRTRERLAEARYLHDKADIQINPAYR